MEIQKPESQIQKGRCKRWIAMLLAGTALGAPTFLMAQPQQSEHFRITKLVVAAGGGASASMNLELTSVLGQPSPLGTHSSEHFLLYGGFLSPTFQMSPLSPIQALVIKGAPSNVTLYWPHVSDATAYKIYRDADPLFTPGPSNYLATVTDTLYVDGSVSDRPVGKNFYIVTATEGSTTAAGGPPGPDARREQTAGRNLRRAPVTAARK